MDTGASPGTPQQHHRRPHEPDKPDRKHRGRELEKTFSDPKEPKRRRLDETAMNEGSFGSLRSEKKGLEAKEGLASHVVEPDTLDRKHHGRQLEKTLSDPKKIPKWVGSLRAARKGLEATEHVPEAEFHCWLESHGVPVVGRERLLPLLEHWGPARTAQVLGLWTFLGDGDITRSVSTSALQVWGPAGTGKTKLVFEFLNTLGVSYISLNCACFVSLGEFQARLVEELRRLAVARANDAASVHGVHVNDLPKELKLPRELQNPAPVGRQIRAFDKLEASMRVSLEYISHLRNRIGASADVDVQWPAKVIVVLDNAQELPRIDAGAIQLLVTLPEILQTGSTLAVVTVSRLPLSSLGLLPAREPPAVAFQPYTEAETEELLFRELSRKTGLLSISILRTLCVGLMKFAVPSLGRNLHQLLRIGEELSVGLLDSKAQKAVGTRMSVLQQMIDEIVQRRLGLCDLRGLLGAGELVDATSATAAITLTMRSMTEVDKRIILAAYLGAHMDKDDDVQLFVAESRRRRRKGSITKKALEDDAGLPYSAHTPRPVPLMRLMAIYHRLARKPQLLAPQLFERLLGLREAGLLWLLGDCHAAADREPKVACRAELPLAAACAAELGVDMQEYLGCF